MPSTSLRHKVTRAGQLLAKGDVRPVLDRFFKTVYKLDPRTRHLAVDYAGWASLEKLLEVDRVIQARYREIWAGQDVWNLEIAGTYIGQHAHLPDGHNPFGLYAANIAVIDFVQRENLDRDAVIVDYCSGYGHLLVLLRALGYRNVYGFDNFTQVDGHSVRRFLASFGHDDALLDAEGLYRLGEIALLTCLCHFFFRTQNSDIVKRSIVHRLALDPRYSAVRVDGYRLSAYYHDLLTVHTRKGPAR